MQIQVLQVRIPLQSDPAAGLGSNNGPGKSGQEEVVGMLTVQKAASLETKAPQRQQEEQLTLFENQIEPLRTWSEKFSAGEPPAAHQLTGENTSATALTTVDVQLGQTVHVPVALFCRSVVPLLTTRGPEL